MESMPTPAENPREQFENEAPLVPEAANDNVAVQEAFTTITAANDNEPLRNEHIQEVLSRLQEQSQAVGAEGNPEGSPERYFLSEDVNKRLASAAANAGAAGQGATVGGGGNGSYFLSGTNNVAAPGSKKKWGWLWMPVRLFGAAFALSVGGVIKLTNMVFKWAGLDKGGGGGGGGAAKKPPAAH